MARGRQRAKQRQAARRDARRADRTGDDAERQADLNAGAPPEDTGRTDTVLEHPPPHTEAGDDYADEEFTDYEEQVEAAEAAGETPQERRERRRAERGHEEHRRDRGKLLTFLANVWAELQRVQWPNRQQLTTLTGVVLGFVLIAGGYLGLLDAIFSRLIKQIL